MKKQFNHAFLLALLIICFTFSSSWAMAQNTPVSAQIEQEVNRILAQYDSDLNVGIKILDLDTDGVLYERNANRSFLPASNQKIFTASAALLKLGPDFKFATKVLSDNVVLANGELKGNLYFQFSGAPDLKTNDLIKLISQAKLAGITTVDGNVIIDATQFNSEIIGPGWMWDDTRYCFSAPISANIINQNCLQFFISPGASLGQPLAIKPNYTNQFIDFTNETTTKNKGQKGCYLKVTPGDHRSYVISGCLPLEKNGIGLSVAMHDPNGYTKSILNHLLLQNGIVVKGDFIFNGTPLIAHEIARVESEPLQALVTKMLKRSDNLISDTLFKTLASANYGKPGTWKNGSKAVKDILTKQYQLNFKNTVIRDGSGLSRYNLLTPNHFIDLLRGMYHNPVVSADFITALPIGGVDGTLKNRMGEANVRNRVHAKTGAMAGVTALSGYIKTTHQKNLAFSILINGAAGPVYKFRVIEDDICRYLAANL